ncbi:MAG: 2-phosphosulfolactate phosphatase, partial [candidate division NC10 bacterium]
MVLTPAELGPDLHSRTAVVIDVFRAATTMVTALASGCRAIVPALTPEEARERARAFPRGEVLLAGE